MIPKVIHYCWFGGNELPKLAKKCIRSWKKHCPDYEIKRWDESNFDINECPLYVRQAYENKKWAFVTDYIRLKLVYENGGIYLDTDVEVQKNIDEFLKYDAFFGFENGELINTGSGFGAKTNHPIVKEIMDQYENISFIKEDGSFDLLACPARNTEVFLKHGLLKNDKFQVLHEKVAILPTEYFCPINSVTKEKNITSNTYTIHWFSGSWLPWKEQAKQNILKCIGKVIGTKNANKIKEKAKKVLKK